MTGTQVFDQLAQDRHSSEELASDPAELPRLAQQMVATSVTSGKMLRELRDRMFPSEEKPETRAIAQVLRAEFELWVAEAEEVYQRAGRLESAGHPVPGSRELDDLIGRAKAMLQIRLDDHFRSLQSKEGKTFTIQELRRELQLERGG